jgi:hypothetical protein
MFEEAFRGVTILHALGATTSLLLALVFVRRRYFSPLSDIPGPFVASFTTSLWQLWHILKGHTEVAVIELHRKHGSPVKAIHITALLKMYQAHSFVLVKMKSAFATWLPFVKSSCHTWIKCRPLISYNIQHSNSSRARPTRYLLCPIGDS